MRIEQVIFSSGDRMPMLLDDADLPVAEACDWALSRRHKAFATQSRNMQELLAQQLAELEAMKSDGAIQSEMEFENKLRALLGEYGYSLREVIGILDPQALRRQ